MNNIEIFENHCIIYLPFKDTILECYIDLIDLDRVKKLTWSARYSESANTYYAFAYDYYPKKRFIHLHRYLMKVSNKSFLEVCIDHVDHNGLNNRRYNLVKKTKRENHYNLRRLNPNNTSGYRGVSYDKLKKKWIAQIQINGTCHARSFETKEEAIQEAKRMRASLGIEMGIE